MNGLSRRRIAELELEHGAALSRIATLEGRLVELEADCADLIHTQRNLCQTNGQLRRLLALFEYDGNSDPSHEGECPNCGASQGRPSRAWV